MIVKDIYCYYYNRWIKIKKRQDNERDLRKSKRTNVLLIQKMINGNVRIKDEWQYITETQKRTFKY